MFHLVSHLRLLSTRFPDDRSREEYVRPAMLLLLVLVCLSIVPNSKSIEIVDHVLDWASDRADKTLLSRCYGKYGCFSIGGKFVSVHRPINLFPSPVSEIDARFLLLPKENPSEFEVLELAQESFYNSSFRPNHPTKFIVHGFIEDGEMGWIKKMARELLRRGDFNIISVDWGKGAGPPYTQAVANTRMVGAILADFITFLMETFNIPPDTFHIIGHSLGAHVSGYAGERIRRLGRITGLDPAQPYFENTHAIVRLDPTDALFVDVIHTDATSIFQGGFGMDSACGHLDFYPNGGTKQPGCADNIIQSIGKQNGDLYGGMRNYIGCNHIRAHEYFTESINPPCPFLGVECSSNDDFVRGACFDCGPRAERCAPLGYHSVLWFDGATSRRRRSVKMYMTTGPSSPYCRFHHRVIVTLADNLSLNDQVGRLQVTMTGAYGFTRRAALNKDDMTFHPATTYMFVIGSKDGGPIEKLEVEWKPSSSVLNQLTWRMLGGGKKNVQVASVEVECLESRYRSSFCFDQILEPGQARSATVSVSSGECSQGKFQNSQNFELDSEVSAPQAANRRNTTSARRSSSSSSSSSSPKPVSSRRNSSISAISKILPSPSSFYSSKKSKNSTTLASGILTDFVNKMFQLLPSK